MTCTAAIESEADGLDDVIREIAYSPVSERGEYPVTKKSMRQWFMRISAYADRLIAGLELVDFDHRFYHRTLYHLGA
jgi:leucyl-tRNA synthetase